MYLGNWANNQSSGFPSNSYTNSHLQSLRPQTEPVRPSEDTQHLAQIAMALDEHNSIKLEFILADFDIDLNERRDGRYVSLGLALIPRSVRGVHSVSPPDQQVLWVYRQRNPSRRVRRLPKAMGLLHPLIPVTASERSALSTHGWAPHLLCVKNVLLINRKILVVANAKLSQLPRSRAQWCPGTTSCQ